MLHRKPPPVPPPLPPPNEHTRQRREDLRIERKPDSICWRTPGDTSWYSCRVSCGEVFIESMHYHPAYDEEPWTATESISPGVFLGGREWERVAEELSLPVLGDILAEVRRFNPGVAPILPGESRGRLQFVVRKPHWVGLIVGAVLLIVVGYLMQRTWSRVGEWYVMRFQANPVSVVAIVRNPHVTFVEHELPKGQKRRAQEVWIELEYDAAGAARRQSLRVAEFTQFEVEQAQRWLADHYRAGDRCPVWHADVRPEQIALSADELTPAFGWIIIDVALLALGLVMAVGAGYLIVMSQPFVIGRTDVHIATSSRVAGGSRQCS
jgi:hypothetical protein